MKVVDTTLSGLKLIEPRVFGDQRGYFLETYHQAKYGEIGIEKQFVQDNLSKSVRGTLRGLHFQVRYPQGKLIQVIHGEVFDVAVDLRAGSPTFGQWEGFYLSGVNRQQLYIPEGFGHGFVVTSDVAFFHYKCTEAYHPEDEGGILWNDEEINIQWPVGEPILSARDETWPTLSSLDSNALPQVQAKKNG